MADSASVCGKVCSLVKIAIAQINPIVGDLAGNSGKIIGGIQRAEAASADLVVFPELAVMGYPPKDLLLKTRFVDRNIAAVGEIAKACKTTTALVGFASRNDASAGRELRNSAALCAGGRVVSVHHKSLLPTYDVFDEHRYFEPGPQTVIADWAGNGKRAKLGISICEDLWNVTGVVPRTLYHGDPIGALAAAGADLFVNISASPFGMGKHDFRLKLVTEHVKRHHLPLVFVNQVGGNDELIFDGASFVLDGDGNRIAQAKAFEEDLLIVDLDGSGHRNERYPDPIASLHDALVLGTRDYVGKCGFKTVVIGLSGGIDSAVTAVVAAEALGPECVTGVAMPSRYSSDHSVADAKALAEALKIEFKIVPIGLMHDAVEQELTPHFDGRAADVTEENIQARLRGNVLMSLSNKFGHLVLTTGNKSELAVGYCTLYGDMCGGLAVISDVPKTMVYGLAREINQRAGREIIPENTITKAPSAELRPDQTDQDSLPPYDVLDRILEMYVEREISVADIVAAGFDEALVADVARKVDRNEYKRKQAASGLKVTSRAFGFGRRLPIAAKYG
jgi:NAD+ synthase (glutamine-hydrolysing)